MFKSSNFSLYLVPNAADQPNVAVDHASVVWTGKMRAATLPSPLLCHWVYDVLFYFDFFSIVIKASELNE